MLTIRTMPTMARMRTLDRALDHAFADTMGAPVPSWMPALDVAERADAYVIVAELPGVDPDRVELSYEQNVLTITGSKPSSFAMPADEELRVFAVERRTGDFSRAIRLPEHVEAERIEARYENGVLYVTVPKSPVAHARKIPIGRGEQRTPTPNAVAN